MKFGLSSPNPKFTKAKKCDHLRVTLMAQFLY